jgi:RNA polymerase sigma-70 factor, ECF subfamily
LINDLVTDWIDILDGFQAFFNETKTRFFHFLIRMTGDADYATDAFQESYLRYWKRYGQNPPNIGLLFTIGHNIAIDGHRRRKHQAPLDDQVCDDRPDQESAVIIKEDYLNMLAAMKTLDPLEREVLSLAADGGFRYEQIAKMTGLSTANVKVKIHRARQKLRRYLGDI